MKKYTFPAFYPVYPDAPTPPPTQPMAEDDKPRRRTVTWGSFSTFLILIGSPLVALYVESPIGWILYTIASIAGIIHTTRTKDGAIRLQFVNYLVWNIAAIIYRVI